LQPARSSVIGEEKERGFKSFVYDNMRLPSLISLLLSALIIKSAAASLCRFSFTSPSSGAIIPSSAFTPITVEYEFRPLSCATVLTMVLDGDSVGVSFDSSGKGSFFFENLKTGTHFLSIAEDSEELAMHVFDIIDLPSATPLQAISSSPPLSYYDDTPRSLPAADKRFSILLVGTSSFDGQTVRFKDISNYLPRSHFDIHFMTFSGDEASSLETLENYYQSLNVSFSSIPPIANVAISDIDVKDDGAYDPTFDPPCGLAELTTTCFRDGLVQYMIERLSTASEEAVASSLPSQDPTIFISPNWVRDVWGPILAAFSSKAPDVVIFGNTGLHNNKLLLAATRHIATKPFVLLDLPNSYPSFGMNIDGILSPSLQVASRSSIEAFALSARPVPVKTFVIPPSIDMSWVFTSSSSTTSSSSEATVDDDAAFHTVVGSRVLAHLEAISCDEAARKRKSCIIAGYNGRLSVEKSVGLILHGLVTALDELNKKSLSKYDDSNKLPPKLVLLVVGDGAVRSALKRLAIELRVASNVIFVGWVDDAHNNLPPYLNLMVTKNIGLSTFVINLFANTLDFSFFLLALPSSKRISL
jgi:glycosyltransferase involved in cell wall biosynthesis